MKTNTIELQKPEILRANKTLRLVNSLILPRDFAVVGSFARMTLGNPANPFCNKSDIDFAVYNKATEEIARKLMNSSYFEGLLETDDYRLNPGSHLEFKIRGPDTTPVHIIGSLKPHHFRTAKNIGGVNYIATDYFQLR
ncbi:hypothetical protein HOD75_01255 [archaeon]|jgi:hypothetical protein|nr:hypothetical protein [archaeon]MBT4241506.1 hypothetical protein [archaeon]MBT4417623.1 hypothetical protein [archaeon]